MTARADLAARRTYGNDGTTLIRVARTAHRCSGRYYATDADGCHAATGERCHEPIAAGALHVEYLGEAAAYQSGKRYHVACAEREGLLRAAETARAS